MRRLLLVLMMCCVAALAPAAIVEGFDAADQTDLNGWNGWTVSDGSMIIVDGSGAYWGGAAQAHWPTAEHTGWGLARAWRPLSGSIDLTVDGTFTMGFMFQGDSNDTLTQIGLANATHELMAGNAYGGGRGINAYYDVLGSSPEQNVDGTHIEGGFSGMRQYEVIITIVRSGGNVDVIIDWYRDAYDGAAETSRTVSLGAVSDTFDRLALNAGGWNHIDEISLGGGGDFCVIPPAGSFSGVLVDYTSSIVNAGFALPGTEKIVGWNGENGEDIPGWASDTAAADSGVEPGGDTDGWRGFFMGGDPAVYQLSSTVIAADTVYEFSKEGSGSLNLSLYYLPDDDPNNTRVILNSASNSVTAVVGAADPAVGRKLGVMIDNLDGSGWPNADYVTLITPIHGATLPSPADNEINVDPATTQITWTPTNDPNFTGTQYLTYYVGTEPNTCEYLDVTSDILSGSVGSYTIPALDYDQVAMWRVDTDIDFGLAEPNLIIGETWQFSTASEIPEVAFDDNVATTLDLMPATLTATVVPAAATTSVFTLLTNDTEYPDGAIVSESSDTTTDPAAPTYSLTTDTAGTYKVMLTVSKAGIDDVIALGEIEVYADSCVAQQTRGTTNYNDYDINADCLVNLDDFAAFAIEWLDDTGLAAPVTYEGPVDYVPEDSIIPLVNSSFEQPDEGKIIGFDMADGAYHDPNELDLAEVPGWEGDDPNQVVLFDSGIEESGNATDGTYIAFLQSGDPNMFQTTSHSIVGDEVFELSFDAAGLWDATEVTATLYALELDGTTRTPLATQALAVTGSMASKELTLDASTIPVEELGRPIGVEFINLSTGWINVDNVLLLK